MLWWAVSNIIMRHAMKLFGSRILEKIKELIFITSGNPHITTIVGASRNTSLKSKQVIFPLHIDSKATIAVSTKSINCMFTYTGLMVQTMAWNNGDSFATNGTRINTVIIEPLKEGKFECRFNPFPYIPSLPESNERWGIKGTIEFQCFYGVFKEDFEFKELVVKSEEWNKFRSEYQTLYPSVFSKIIEVIS